MGQGYETEIVAISGVIPTAIGDGGMIWTEIEKNPNGEKYCQTIVKHASF